MRAGPVSKKCSRGKIHHRDTENTEKIGVPAKAGIHFSGALAADAWGPAFAGAPGVFLILRVSLPRRENLLHRREAGGLQERVRDALDDRAVRLGLGPLAVPFRIGLEGVPLLLAISERVPFQQVVERLVRIADQDGPKAGLLDAVALPDLQGNR